MTMQRFILIMTALVIAGLGLFPPFEAIDGARRVPLHHGWVLAPLKDKPQPGREATAKDLKYLGQHPDAQLKFYRHFGFLPSEMHDSVQWVAVDLRRLLVEWLGAILVGGLLWVAVRPTSRQARRERSEFTAVSGEDGSRARTGSSVDRRAAVVPIVSGESNTSPETYRELGRQAAKRFNPYSWQMIVGVLLISLNIRMGSEIREVSPAFEFGLWAVTVAFIGWGLSGSPRYLPRNARRYRRHCEQWDLQIIGQKIEGQDAMAECQAWRITEKQRLAALDSVLMRKLAALKS
jgi:hypothetical protein